MPTKDPRSYIQRVALPISPQKGLKIQARCSTVYNPVTPTREVVRKVNYRRRQEQLHTQGFNALNHKPYKGIGDPFYLDEKRLVLSALGQLDDSDDFYSTSSSDEDETHQRSTISTPYNRNTAAKFMLRRKRKDLNNLNKEVSHGRSLIRNVKLGHGLFDLIKQERTAKKAAIAKAYREKVEEAKNAWQPPKSDSSDESDDAIPHDVELDSSYYSGDERDSIFLTQPKDHKGVAFSSDGGSRPSSSRSTPRKKKKNIPPRPFTPKYTSLSEVTDHTQDFETNLNSSRSPTRDASPESLPVVPVVSANTSIVSADCKNPSYDVSRDSLFRQLCVLNWILEAMNLDQGYSMCPITTCWKLTKSDIGGSKISTKKLQKEKTTETNWNHFVTNTGVHSRMNKRSSGQRLSRQFTSRRVFLRTSVQSSVSPSNSVTQLNVNSLSNQLHPGGTIPEDSSVSPVQEPPEEEETAYSRMGSTGIFKFLDEYYATLKPETDGPDKTDDTTSERHKREKRASISDGKSSRKSHRKSSKQERRESRVQSARTNSTDDRLPSRGSSTNSRIIRPKSSPGLIEYQATLPSNKYSTLSTDFRLKFEEIQEDKALTLHELLQQLDRERLGKCQNKFSAMRPKSSIVHRALDEMREEGSKLMTQSAQQLRKKSSFKGNWFTDLQDCIPKELRELWYYSLVLGKLAKHGLIESSSKLSVYQFIKVLGELRDWEICSPDITAAIEFCREKIVDMTVEDFEEWFHQQFPTVWRPPTVIPTKTKDKKDPEFRSTPQSQTSRPTTTAATPITINYSTH
ncbi:uncharacterized protein LOC126821884 isoform X1 [Patella vulgata]|uniref:uncharacterized protein LOC126821884 isoform X1 n=1 Tax=Patella vulgata TaxID=6465 RepID=UPI002180767C|nr:uncharacterized protein LOC126821884 isoform X1 [Patella vulgata]